MISSEGGATSTPVPAPLPRSSGRRRRLRYLIPRFDSTIVLCAHIPRLAGGQRLPAPLPYRAGAPQEVRPYLENLPPVERKSALRRLESADLVVYSLGEDGELAFWEFVQLGQVELPADVGWATGEQRCAYLFGAFTREPYRGQGLFTGGLHWLIDWLAAQDYTHLYSQTAVDNVVSLLAHLTAGFEALGEGRHVHWGGRRIMRRTRLLARPVAASCTETPDLRGVSPVAQESLRRALLCPR